MSPVHVLKKGRYIHSRFCCQQQSVLVLQTGREGERVNSARHTTTSTTTTTQSNNSKQLKTPTHLTATLLDHPSELMPHYGPGCEPLFSLVIGVQVTAFCCCVCCCVFVVYAFCVVYNPVCVYVCVVVPAPFLAHDRDAGHCFLLCVFLCAYCCGATAATKTTRNTQHHRHNTQQTTLLRPAAYAAQRDTHHDVCGVLHGGFIDV